MCIAIPSQVVSIHDRTAVIDTGGVQRSASLMMTPGARVGDYVIVHAGFAIQILDEAAAKETLALLKEAAVMVDSFPIPIKN